MSKITLVLNKENLAILLKKKKKKSYKCLFFDASYNL